MNNFKYKEIIQDTIEQIRRRKTRPDLERITKFISRKYGVPVGDVEAEVNDLVEQKVISRIEYRGQVSYRNKHSAFVNSEGKPLNSMTVTNILIKAIAELSNMKRDSPERSYFGVSFEDILKYFEDQFSDLGITAHNLKCALAREVCTNMRIIKLSSGNYIINKHFISSQRCSGRTAFSEHIKPPKNYLKENMMNNVQPDTLAFPESPCNICDNPLKEKNSILTCNDCHVQVHAVCAAHPLNGTAWLCKECRLCWICGQTSKGDLMISCSLCDRAYHIRCHWPQVSKDDLNKHWVCGQCTFQENDSSEDSASDTTQQSECDSGNKQPYSEDKQANCSANEDEPISFVIRQARSHDESTTSNSIATALSSSNRISMKNYPQYVPDVRLWTAEDVEYFITCVGFPREAQQLRFHEVDGIALLLLQRTDVISMLNIKLGPALKLYRHIMHLQSAHSSQLPSCKL